MTYQRPYQPKKPVRSFQDLEVYQKALALSVTITKRIPAQTDHPVILPLRTCALELPILITTAHSIRFSAPQEAIDTLEHAMLTCNKTIVYLEQYRDIYNDGIEHAFFEEQIKILLSSRVKIMHLQWSWKKFHQEKQQEKTL